MSVLITGGFGLVGGRLAVHLAAAGYDVRLGTRQKRPVPPWLASAVVTQTSWDSTAALVQACRGVDMVIHAAGMNAADCARNPGEALEFNGGATARLAEAAAEAGVHRLLYMSTAHVYRSPLAGVVTEDMAPVNPHPYATSHLAGEDAVMAAAQRGVLDGVVMRLSNAFGAPTHRDVNCWMLLVNDLCRQAARDRVLVLRTSGAQERDFIAIDDVSTAAQLLLELPAVRLGPGRFNVGSGRSIAVLAMAQRIANRCEAVLNHRPALEVGVDAPAPPEDTLDYRVDRMLALGWTPKEGVDAEIDRTLRFCAATWAGRG
jgi:UDP-glucose 4-epimerase